MSGELPPSWPDHWTPPRLTVADLMRDLRMEAERIIVVQQLLIETGARRSPDQVQLRRALSMHKAETFMVSCAPYLPQIQALIERLQMQGPRR